jgi:hypothetical protein
MVTPFLPKSHPWRMRWFTLGDWTTKRTTLTKDFDTIFWIYFILVVFILLTATTPADH